MWDCGEDDDNNDGLCAFIQRWDRQLLSKNYRHSGPPRQSEEIPRTTSTIMPDTCSGVSHPICLMLELQKTETAQIKDK